MAKMVVVMASPRKGNSETIAKKIAEEAKGYDVEYFRINDLKNIRGCQACMSCKKTGKCAFKDDIFNVLEAIRAADALVVASPDYFGQPCAQYRIFEDRMYSFMGADFAPNIGKKKVAVVVSCGGGYDGAVKMADAMEGVFVNFFKAESVGKIVMPGGLAPDVAANNAEIMAQAAEIGKKF